MFVKLQKRRNSSRVKALFLDVISSQFYARLNRGTFYGYLIQDIRGDHQCSSASLSENLEKENGKTPRSTKSRRKVVSAEECDTCSPPFHTCKQFANITGNFTPNRRNIKLNKFVELKPIDIYKCEVCSKVRISSTSSIFIQMLNR